LDDIGLVIVEKTKHCETRVTSSPIVSPTSTSSPLTVSSSPTILATSSPSVASLTLSPSLDRSKQHGIHNVEHGLVVIYSLFLLPILLIGGFFIVSRRRLNQTQDHLLDQRIALD